MYNQKLICSLKLNSTKKTLTALLIISLLLCMVQLTVFAANEPTTIPVDTGDTLENAVTQANNLPSAIIEIRTNLTVTSTITITSNIAIISTNGDHTITNCPIQVKDGGKLTLGDGTNTGLLTILGSISVTDGEINIQDGVKITSSNQAIRLSGSNANGAIHGGIFEGAPALYMENGAQLSEIDGGMFYSRQDTVY